MCCSKSKSNGNRALQLSWAAPNVQTRATKDSIERQFNDCPLIGGSGFETSFVFGGGSMCGA
eukprot:6431527-Amphidinium_carterae.1